MRWRWLVALQRRHLVVFEVGNVSSRETVKVDGVTVSDVKKFALKNTHQFEIEGARAELTIQGSLTQLPTSTLVVNGEEVPMLGEDALLPPELVPFDVPQDAFSRGMNKMVADQASMSKSQKRWRMGSQFLAILAGVSIMQGLQTEVAGPATGTFKIVILIVGALSGLGAYLIYENKVKTD